MLGLKYYTTLSALIASGCWSVIADAEWARTAAVMLVILLSKYIAGLELLDSLHKQGYMLTKDKE